MRNAYKVLVENPEMNRWLRDLRVDGKMILKCVLKTMRELDSLG
jgi:hypothetical protein